MKFRKIDFIIFYIIVILLYGINLIIPIKTKDILTLFIVAILPALILGTISNLIFRKR
ncbi:MAG: hypothetical protein ACM3X7_07270 [Solirubrobacterales bacterium]